VVIAIIAILTAMLLPVLSQAKGRALNIACWDNLKQLQLCFQLYVGDNDDFMPPNNFVYDITTTSARSWQPTDLPGAPMWLLTMQTCRHPKRVAFPIQHCGCDLSLSCRPIKPSKSGAAVPTIDRLRLRSYNLSQSVMA